MILTANNIKLNLDLNFGEQIHSILLANTKIVKRK